ncbi:hypothetical protein FM103_16045 [Corynebacterium xerosis]|nr:hypothetical protein FM103_16045 [Corynebacterium xerosis]
MLTAVEVVRNEFHQFTPRYSRTYFTEVFEHKRTRRSSQL